MSDYQLARDGLVLLPLYTRDQLTERRTAFDADVASMPELKPPHEGETLDDRPCVGGGTSFVGGSICHAPSVRRVERDAYDAAAPVLRAEGARRNMPRLAQIKDRVCFRPRGVVPTGETAHRDLSPASPVDDIVIYGGWVPLNDGDGQEQYFSCVPGTHEDACARDARGGFRSLTRDETRAYKARIRRVCIPLGWMLVFDQRLVHEVVADRRPYAIRRVFTAFEIARATVQQPLLQRLGWTPARVAEMFDQQGPFLIKSGQECRTFPKLWAVNWRPRLEAFSRCRVRKWTRDAGGRVQRVFPAVPLAARHAAWTEAERARFSFH